MDLGTTLTALTIFSGVVYWIFESPLLGTVVQKSIHTESSVQGQAWALLQIFYNTMFGEKLVSFSAIACSARMSILMMIFFVMWCYFYTEIPSSFFLQQYLIAAIILNIIGDYISVLQTRFLFTVQISDYRIPTWFLVLIDAAMSIIVFFVFYCIALFVNLKYVGSDKDLYESILNNIGLSISNHHPHMNAFLLFSFATSMFSTITHFFGLFAIIYIKFAERIGFNVEEKIEFHMRYGLIFIVGLATLLVHFVVFIISVI